MLLIIDLTINFHIHRRDFVTSSQCMRDSCQILQRSNSILIGRVQHGWQMVSIDLKIGC